MRPGEFGSINLAYTDRDICGAGPARYARLRVTTRDGASTETAYPGEMSVASCRGSQAEAGRYNAGRFGTPRR